MKKLNKGVAWIRKCINDTIQNKIVETLTSDTVSKILNKKYGSFSGNVFKIYYNSLKMSTKGSVHCLVNVFIYDNKGNLCGSIVANKTETDTGDIFLYCEGDEKYFTLIGADYNVKLIGNDIGSISYSIEEYRGTELLRTIKYEDIALSDGKIYTAMIPKTQLLDSAVYNLISDDDAELIMPSSDTMQISKYKLGDVNQDGNLNIFQM